MANRAVVMGRDARTLAWATLAHKALPQQAIAALLRAFGNPEAVLGASRASLAGVVSHAAVQKLLDGASLQTFDTTLRWLDDEQHHLIAWDDADYPQALLELGDAPPVLFFIGRRELLNRPGLAIVGSRNATPQGVETARDFAAALASAGLTIISGLASGIDAAAHEGGLLGAGSTLAIVGTGLDRVYPARNRALAQQIAAAGGLLSEYVPGTPPRKENFPRRNRLISGLARGVLVVEATLSSGSLITARNAGDQGREVFAIPGSIHSPFSRGCHRLIREGAKLVETAQDVLDEFRWPSPWTAGAAEPAASPAEGAEPAAFPAASPGAGDAAQSGSPGVETSRLLAALGHDPATIDTLVLRTGLAPGAIAAELVALELERRVASLPGGCWQRLGPS